MLLSIDRVLQLIAEGKGIEKIADMAKCEPDDVVSIIEEARQILRKYDKPHSRKKVIIKRAGMANSEGDDEEMKEIFEGAELAAVPLESQLTIYTDGASKGNPGPAGIGIVIFDKEDRQDTPCQRCIITRLIPEGDGTDNN